MKKIIALSLVFLIAAISGCLGGNDVVITETGNGLEIVNFSSTLADVYGAQTTHITMAVENQGESKVVATHGIALLIIPGDWVVTQSKALGFKKDLNFEDPNKGSVAGIEYFTWSAKAPELMQGTSRTDTITGRIFYDYQTKASGTLWVYPEDEALSDQSREAGLSTMTYDTTRGPITVEVEVMPDPVRVYSSPESFNVNLKFTNTNDGVVYKNGFVTTSSYKITDAERNKLTATMTIQGLTVDNTCLDNIEFFGDTASTTCDVTVTSAPATKQSYPISVTLDYGYYKDATFDIGLTGKQ